MINFTAYQLPKDALCYSGGITLPDIMSQYNEQFMFRLGLVSALFLAYTSYNVFIREPRPKTIPLMEQIKIYFNHPHLLIYDYNGGFARTFDELMLIPAVFACSFVIAYYTRVWI